MSENSVEMSAIEEGKSSGVRVVLPGVYTYRKCDICNGYGSHRVRNNQGDYEDKNCPKGCTGPGTQTQTQPTPKEKPCSRCGGRRTIRVLGGGGDYEDWPCPECRPEDHRQTIISMEPAPDGEAE